MLPLGNTPALCGSSSFPELDPQKIKKMLDKQKKIAYNQYRKQERGLENADYYQIL